MERDRGLITVDSAPQDHKYYTMSCGATNNSFLTTLNNELKILRTSLPAGIWIKHYEDRIQLLSAMIRGPDQSIYENSVFLFDIYLPNSYPNAPPSVHYYSNTQEKINPNLYQCGKVCLSLLGTWPGNLSETWSNKSTLLQVFISIQSLVLVKEPYYNEPGTVVDLRKSKQYNTSAFYSVVEGQIKMFNKAPTMFSEEVKTFTLSVKEKIIRRLLQWRKKDSQFCDDFIINQICPTFVEDLLIALENLF